MKYFQRLIIFIFFIPFSSLKAQDGENEFKKIIIIDGKRYKPYNNWLSLSAGAALNTGNPNLQFVGGLDYNFHIKGNYFQLGLFLSGDDFGNYNNYNLAHLCYGKRKEDEKKNFSYFGGLSYSTGYEREGGGYKATPYQQLGLYASTEYIKKLTYDVGLGGSFFVDVNLIQTIIGLRANVFFSGAYKGKASKKELFFEKQNK